jgi:hypothetical protein
MSATPRPPLRAEARRDGYLEEVAAAPSLHRRTLMNDTKKLTRRRGGRGENQRLIIPTPRSPRLRVKLSSPSCCCTKPSPENCDERNERTHAEARRTRRNPCFILPPPRSPRLRVKLSSPSCCCTKPSPANCDIQNMSTVTTYPKNMAQKSKNIDIWLSLCKEISIFFT